MEAKSDDIVNLALDHGTKMKELGYTEGYYKGYKDGTKKIRDRLFHCYEQGIIDEKIYDEIVGFFNKMTDEGL